MREEHNYRFGVIDVDGTLLDSKRFHRKMIRVCSQLSDRFDFLSQHNFLYAVSSCTLFSYSCQRLPFLKGCKKFLSVAARLDRLILEFFNIIDIDSKGLKLFPGTREVLESLLAEGMELFATTVSKTKKTEERLKNAGILEFFTLVLGEDVLSKSEHVPYFAQHLGSSLRDFAPQSFYLGDSVHDMRLAKLYGLYGIGITNTVDVETLLRAGARGVITEWQELLKQEKPT